MRVRGQQHAAILSSYSFEKHFWRGILVHGLKEPHAKKAIITTGFKLWPAKSKRHAWAARLEFLKVKKM